MIRLYDHSALKYDNIWWLSQTSVEENESTDWLPNGWVMEERQRKGSSSKASTYKVWQVASLLHFMGGGYRILHF